jgi:hypothetical protein
VVLFGRHLEQWAEMNVSGSAYDRVDLAELLE